MQILILSLDHLVGARGHCAHAYVMFMFTIFMPVLKCSQCAHLYACAYTCVLSRACMCLHFNMFMCHTYVIWICAFAICHVNMINVFVPYAICHADIYTYMRLYAMCHVPTLSRPWHM